MLRSASSPSGVPVLGICYGQQTMAEQLGGKVEAGHHREFGRAFLSIDTQSPLFEGVWAPGTRHQVWMSHGDRVTRLPDGFQVIATSENAPFAAVADEIAALLRRAIPSRGRSYSRRRQADLELRAQDRWAEVRLDDGRVPARDDRQDPRAGRQGQGHLRAVGRCR